MDRAELNRRIVAEGLYQDNYEYHPKSEHTQIRRSNMFDGDPPERISPLIGNRQRMENRTTEVLERHRKQDMDDPSIKVCLSCPLKECAESSELDLAAVSRVEVARAVHCVPEHISNVLMGKAVMSLPLAYDVAKYLGVTLDEFYKAITGANGKNPARKYRPMWRIPTPPKYTVNGKGYPNLREALQAIGIERNNPTHYAILPDSIKHQIIRNRPNRGR